MKKILLFALAALVTITLPACDSKDKPKDPSTEQPGGGDEKPGGGDEKPGVEEGAFTASIVSVETKNIVVNVDKGDYEGNFYLGCAAKADYVGDAEAWAKALIEQEIEYYETDLSVVDNAYVFSVGGEINVGNSWNLISGTEYVISIFGIDASGNITTDIVELVESTKAVDKTDGYINFEIVEASTTNIEIKAMPNGVDRYTYCMLPNYDYLYSCEADNQYLAETALASLQENGYELRETDGTAILSGEQTISLSEMWGMVADVDHTFILFGLDEAGNVNTDITVGTCMAGAEDVSIDGTISLSLVESSASGIVVSAKISGDIENYYVAPLQHSWLGDYYDNSLEEAALATLYEDITYYGTDFSIVDDVYVFNASNDYINLAEGWEFEANTDYHVFACGINENGRPVTEIFTVDATTRSASAVSTSRASSSARSMNRKSFKPAMHLAAAPEGANKCVKVVR